MAGGGCARAGRPATAAAAAAARRRSGWRRRRRREGGRQGGGTQKDDMFFLYPLVVFSILYVSKGKRNRLFVKKNVSFLVLIHSKYRFSHFGRCSDIEIISLKLLAKGQATVAQCSPFLLWNIFIFLGVFFGFSVCGLLVVSGRF